jgi:hypothetical protein
MSSFEVVVLEVVVLEVVVLEIVVSEVVAFDVVVLEDVFLEDDDFLISSFDSVISFASFEDAQFFDSLKNLILRVNQHVDSKNYAVVLARIKKFKLDETRKV